MSTQQQTTVDDLTAGLGKLHQSELVRGNRMADVEERCLRLCHAYIGGSWCNAQTAADILVTRISGGFTNQLYRVRLKKHVQRAATNPIYTTEPSEVAIKLYLAKHMANFAEGESERLNDMIILTMVSALGLGPPVYGIFADGFVQAFRQHEQFRAKHQARDNLKRDVLTLLAKINHLQVPIQKKANLILADLRRKIQFGYDHCQVEKLAEELELPTLKRFHVMKEYEELLLRIEALNAPVVFCHNDFRGSNLLVTKDDDTEQILAIDFEYSGYGTRGFDLACLITEWGRKDLFDASTPLPTEATVEELTRLYIEECDKVVPGYSQQEGNSLTQHLQEVRLMFLANSMYFLAVMISQQESIIPSMPFDAEKQMQFVEVLFKGYIDFKNLLISNGYIKKM